MHWQVTAIGRRNLALQHVANLGGMLRTGLEDFSTYHRAKRLVEMVVIDALASCARTPDANRFTGWARQILGLSEG